MSEYTMENPGNLTPGNWSKSSLKKELEFMMPIIESKLLSSPNRTYPEEKFRHYFAPFFLGFQEIPPNQDLMYLWVGEVGSYHEDVHIVDPAGNVLFIVPPMLNVDLLSIRENAASRIRFRGLEAIKKAESLNFPQQAQENHDAAMAYKVNTLLQGPYNPSAAEKWLKIYEYYNVAPPSTENVRFVDNKNHRDGKSGPPTSQNNGGWGNGEDYYS